MRSRVVQRRQSTRPGPWTLVLEAVSALLPLVIGLLTNLATADKPSWARNPWAIWIPLGLLSAVSVLFAIQSRRATARYSFYRPIPPPSAREPFFLILPEWVGIEAALLALILALLLGLIGGLIGAVVMLLILIAILWMLGRNERIARIEVTLQMIIFTVLGLSFGLAVRAVSEDYQNGPSTGISRTSVPSTIVVNTTESD
jgi:membrane protein implicated in regulation of membrane protease activity